MIEPNICMYCGRHGNASDEHVVAEWVGKAIFGADFTDPSSMFTHRFYDTLADAEGVRYSQRGMTTKQGNLGTRVVRCVCRPCNMDWMGKIQEAVKPILAPFLRGEWAEPNLEQAEILATWACMTTINVDASDPNGGGILPPEKVKFYEARSPSEDWGIWIAPKTGGDQLGVYHRPFGVRFAPLAEAQQAIDKKIGMNSQITTMELGRLLVHCVHFPGLAEKLDVLQYSVEIGMAPIFPTWMSDAFEWKDIQILPQTQVHFVSNALYVSLVDSGFKTKEMVKLITQ